MFFNIFSSVSEIEPNSVVLFQLSWNDWYRFQTSYNVVYYDEQRTPFQLGSVKIGQVGLIGGRVASPGVRSPDLPVSFDALDERFFSLGEKEGYYENLNTLRTDVRTRILAGLRDCAFDLSIFDQAFNEEVMEESLLRSISPVTVRNRYHRLARGDVILTDYNFAYAFPDGAPKLDFEVVPESEPPTNIHVLIGRNGVGKTRCMRSIAEALVSDPLLAEPDGASVSRIGERADEWSFAGLVLISFSAFDDFDIRADPFASIRFSRIGLRKSTDDKEAAIKSPTDLAEEFLRSLDECRHGVYAERWLSAVQALENDPLFEEANIGQLLSMDDAEFRDVAFNVFRGLSSGHAIVLLTITNLVELLTENTLVLFDEPESHLHPPLLSAFLRALSNLLTSRNGVAIIATHSPVVLQEVPKSCVWKLRRSGIRVQAERPLRETFGENVGTLTREVFGLEVTNTGFHRMIKDAIARGADSYEAVLSSFGMQVGSEGRAIARSLLTNNDGDDR